MRRSIFFKTFIGCCTIVVAMSGLMLAFTFHAIREDHIETTAENLTTTAIALKDRISPLVITERLADLDVLVKKLGGDMNMRITVIDPGGLVLADSQEDPKKMDNHGTRTEVAQALDGKTGRFLRFSETTKQEMLYIAVPMVEENKAVGVLRLSLYLKDVNRVINTLQIRLLQSSLAIIMFALLFSLWFSRNLWRPIHDLKVALQKVASKDFRVRIFLRNNDELKDLADSFNDMVNQMRGLFSELSRQKEELSSIITSLEEGLLVLDREERVIFLNDSLQKIVGEDLREGAYYWENFREPAFSELVKWVKTAGQSRVEEIGIRNRVYLCSATFLKSQEEVAVVMHDITDMKNLQKIKTDFVLNVSHELRTPLTSIKGFVETLAEEVTDDQPRRYLEIIGRNTDRVINIINDLLLLSELEGASQKLELALVHLPELIDNVAKIFEQKLQHKGLSFKLDIVPGIPPIMADAFKLEQVFINLIDNAVKYTEAGSVSVRAEGKGNVVEIVVEDTGAGIPREYLSRIFERFYVVDKSRSRAVGGTGLGLSIVKHVITLHNGTIHVDSTLGSGTRFVVTLPVDLQGLSS
jgi:two-component system, OmpR family, phosphate regulon sensor histidine kinase PhoR